jgi:hypothetical protein
MANASQFQNRGSAERWLEMLAKNASAQAQNITGLFELAAYAHLASIELPRVEAMLAEQQAEISSIREQIEGIDAELAKFSDRQWLMRIFESAAHEDKRRQELADERERLGTLLQQALPVLDELDYALLRLKSRDSMPELPAWLSELLRQ